MRGEPCAKDAYGTLRYSVVDDRAELWFLANQQALRAVPSLSPISTTCSSFFAEASTGMSVTPLKITFGQYIGFTAIMTIGMMHR